MNVKKLIAVAAVAASATLQMAARAADVEWQGGGSTDGSGYYLISAADNWGGTAPAATDGVVFNSGTVNVVGDLSCADVKIATDASGVATLEKKGGDWTLSGSLYVSEGLESTGTFRHSGGTMTLSNPLFVGSTSQQRYTAQMDITGGTVYANYTGTSGELMRSMIVGRCAYATGGSTVNVSGDGRLVVANVFWLGAGGPGTLNISGNGEVDISGGNLVFHGRYSNNYYIGAGNALLWLNGGRLTTKGISYNGGDASTKASAFYFNGGTLRAAADNANFLRTTGNTRVMGGGGTIDTAGHSIEIQQTLEANHQGNNKSGTLTITGGGSYTQTGATKYSGGSTVVDGNTKYIKNNNSMNLDIVVKGGSSFQNAPTLTTRRAGNSLTFEDGAGICLDLDGFTQTVYCSAVAINVQGALVVSSTSANPPEGTYTLLAIAGTGTFPDSILSNVSFSGNPANVTFSLSADRKSIIYSATGAHDWSWSGAGDGVSFSDGANWTCGSVPNATSDLYFAMPAVRTLVNDIANLSVNSITFTAECGSQTIGGNGISIATASGTITNSSGRPQTFTAPVAFAGAVQAKQNIKYNNSTLQNEASRIVFEGGVTGTRNSASYDNRVFCGHWILSETPYPALPIDSAKRPTVYRNSSFTVDQISSSQAMYVLDGGAVTSATLTVDSKCIATTCLGEFVVNGTLTYDTDTDLSVSGGKSTADKFDFNNYTAGSIAAVKARTMNMTGSRGVMLAGNGTAITVNMHLGDGGMKASGTQHYYVNKSGSKLFFYPWKCDTSIEQAASGADATTLEMRTSGAALTFVTDDEDGVARTISLNGIVKTVAGAVTSVKGAGTLALTKSQQLAGGLSVGGAATLKVAKSGTVALGGNLTLADGATLGFNFTEKGTAPVLDLTDKTVTAAGTVNVKVGAADGITPRGGRYALTSGGAFTGATVSFDEASKPKWARGVSVVDGDIVLDVISRGFMIIVK